METASVHRLDVRDSGKPAEVYGQRSPSARPSWPRLPSPAPQERTGRRFYELEHRARLGVTALQSEIVGEPEATREKGPFARGQAVDARDRLVTADEPILEKPVLHGDVAVVADDLEAMRATQAMVSAMPELRPLDGGPLENAIGLEAFCAVLLTVNLRYGGKATLRLMPAH